MIEIKTCQQQNNQIVKVVENLSITARSIFNVLLQYGNLGGWIYPAQGTIARKSDCTRQWTNIQLQKMEEKGLLVSVHRGHRQTNLYIINPIFNEYTLRKSLVDYLPAFKWSWFSHALTIWQDKLIESFNSIQSAELTLLNKKALFKYLVIFSLYSSNKLTALRREVDVRARSVVQEMLMHLPKNIQIEKEYMEANPIMAEILALKELPLTKWGQIELMQFAPAVILYAHQRLKTQRGKLNNPFKWFYVVCINETTKRKLARDFTKLKFLQETYQKPYDAPLIYEDVLHIAEKTAPWQPSPTPLLSGKTSQSTPSPLPPSNILREWQPDTERKVYKPMPGWDNLADEKTMRAAINYTFPLLPAEERQRLHQQYPSKERRKDLPLALQITLELIDITLHQEKL